MYASRIGRVLSNTGKTSIPHALSSRSIAGQRFVNTATCLSGASFSQKDSRYALTAMALLASLSIASADSERDTLLRDTIFKKNKESKFSFTKEHKPEAKVTRQEPSGQQASQPPATLPFVTAPALNVIVPPVAPESQPEHKPEHNVTATESQTSTSEASEDVAAPQAPALEASPEAAPAPVELHPPTHTHTDALSPLHAHPLHPVAEATLSASAEPVIPAEDASGTLSATYVIVGAGTAAWSALKALRERHPDATVIMVGDEQHPPYNRTPLSKEMWTMDHEEAVQELFYKNFLGKLDNLLYAPADAYQGLHNVKVLFGSKATGLDLDARTLSLSTGETVKFDKLLLATGGSPMLPSQFVQDAPAGAVSTYRTLDDFRRLYELAKTAKHITVIGGGFLGTELACALAHKAKSTGLQVTLVVPEPGVLYRYIPRFLSEYLTLKLRAAGVDLRTSTLVRAVTPSKDGNHAASVSLKTWTNVDLPTDHVVVAVGITPNNELAKEAGLEIDPKNGGILVNSELSASTGVYAAGDVVSYWDRVLGRRRIEHYDHAVVSGRVAGENLAGAKQPYNLQSMFWCDMPLIHDGFEAVGLIDSSLDTVAYFEVDRAHSVVQGVPSFLAQDYKKGVIYYLRDKKVVGVLLFNHWEKTDEARKVIANRQKYDKPAEQLRNTIPLEGQVSCIDMSN
eukprot:TRINITY_DN4071_c0_g1::TRINITY_DN4071_c0_g1_i1::g.11871::m.11871 TRINITY_DN4071_c0_g1::TRINITY_DN4071_c0_g1_i1::g.11871  ORF type:complete len:696 (+),score=190.76,sp/Q9GRX6/AIFM1_DICDI/39.78/2e-94,Pyr_redox_2/PF07992.9/1.1e-27,AIF_C/PF14721.1/8.4e+03,AIF_C/PF14721.1/5.4e+03,AIF_C/PF14721.1/3.6e-13,AIF_C/PF14721.1/2.9e-09,Pyr_redox/PF00070.22/1.2e+02,Pyr_redox/PF00070.22/8.2e+03,Pyr_redox/PF00070.22/9.1e-14,K_oxygenase/PF13434.1/49,K_oxygenase/PF13434.1/2.8e-06,K_oxygenase/PF13434.1/2.5e+02,Pyr_r